MLTVKLIDENQKVSVKSSAVILNSKKGFEDLQHWIIKHQKENLPLVICMEATGIYHENCAYYLFDKGFSVSIILPNKAKKYLEAIGLKSKNDSIDAKGNEALTKVIETQCEMYYLDHNKRPTKYEELKEEGYISEEQMEKAKKLNIEVK